MTLVELVLAMTLIVIVFAAVVPLFPCIRNSWDSKQGHSEALQNGRILIDHINRNLSKAVSISAVSESSESSGYIEFEDNDGNTMRYDISGGNYVEYGETGSLSDLAGPVSQLQFTCYDGNDFSTATTDVNSIRYIEVQTTVTNSVSQAAGGKTFATSVYLRANDDDQARVFKGTPFEYDTTSGQTPALVQIDSTHYLCAYAGSGSGGWAVVLTVDTDNWTVSRATPFEFDDVKATTPALSGIDGTHYLCVYTDKFSDGQAVVLTVDTADWSISKETPLEYETTQATTPALTKIDTTHYLCVYTDKFSDGQAVVLTVDTADWSITKETPLEYETDQATTPALAKIDASHYLCTYADKFSDGRAVVLTVDSNNWTISCGTNFEYDDLSGESPSLAQIDSTQYLCAYTGADSDGWAVVLTVDISTWTISAGTKFEFDESDGQNVSLARMDPNDCLCAYTGPDSEAWAIVLTVDSDDRTISKGASLEFDSTKGEWPALAQIDLNNYLCAYDGPDDDAWSLVLTVEFRPTP